jgi:hypothetical protein
MVEMIAEKVAVWVGCYCTILIKDLKMHCVCQNVVPRMLTQILCDDHMRILCELNR